MLWQVSGNPKNIIINIFSMLKSLSLKGFYQTYKFESEHRVFIAIHYALVYLQKKGLRNCVFFDVGAGSGKVLVHASFYCDSVIGIELDSLSYLISCGILASFVSSKIALIQGDIGDLPPKFPDLTDGKCYVVWANCVGWGDEDLEKLRFILDRSKDIRVVAVNYVSKDKKSNPMNLFETYKDSPVQWILFQTIRGIKLRVSGESLAMRVFTRDSREILQTPRNKGKPSLWNAFEVVKELHQQNQVYHFLGCESEDFKSLGEETLLAGGTWCERAESFLSNNCNYGMGRFASNYNNCCYANSFLILFCSIPTVRNVIDNCSLALPSRNDIEKSPVSALLFIILVYVKSRKTGKAHFRLNYLKSTLLRLLL
jgi:precorrin-6B methylase 2